MAEASKGSYIDVMEDLLDFGADIDAYDDALVYAARGGHMDVVERFLHKDHVSTAKSEKGPFCSLLPKEITSGSSSDSCMQKPTSMQGTAVQLISKRR